MVGDVDHCFRFFQNWHTPELLSEKKYPFNILKDNEFEKSRKVLEAKRKSLVHEHGKGNKLQVAQAIDEDEEDALFEAGEFGDSNPVALQRTVWWFLSLHFSFRARDESLKLRWGDVQLQQQYDGQEVLVWLVERGTKTRHGQERGHRRAFQPKIYATNTARCPVSFYKKIQQSPASGNERIRIAVLLSGPP